MAPWTRRLIAANVAVFVLTTLSPEIKPALELVPAALTSRPWTIITYMFVHENLGHIFFNMLALFFCGPRLEDRLGGGAYLGLYLVSGITGGLFSFFFTPFVATLGASGAVFGVMLGYARYWPRDRFYIWGVLPIEARLLVVILTVIELVGSRVGGDNIAHFAHLGGFAGGFIFLLIHDRRAPAGRFQKAARPSTPPPDRDALARWNAIPAESLHEVNRHELERIRRKIAELGVGSLTPGDREFLERFSARG
jgi:membrane associated rhomboid family serine protease